MKNIQVFLLEDWVDPLWRTHAAGERLWLPVAWYRKGKGLGLFGRELIRCRHWSGVEYWHAAGCGGKPMLARYPPPRILEAKRGAIPPPPSYTPEISNPAVAARLGAPPPGVVRAGCGGCAKRRAELLAKQKETS